ncbi:hypothetical protein ACTACQ_05060 [Pseudomonas syringae]|uniref:hypothetical protein n=1 Tax=Pseudomonas syringae TaxID=317 RepID=UPI003F7AC6A6
MDNKPSDVRVSRELLEVLANTTLSSFARIEAITLLAQPADQLGEPVFRDQQVTELAEFMGRLSGGLRHFAGQIIDAGWQKIPTHQADPAGFLDPEFSWATISSENKNRMEALGHDLSCFSKPLYRHAQPATVKVDDQEEFEAWFLANVESDEGLTLERSAARPDQYELDETAQIYRGWLARAKLNGASKVVLPERKLICGYEDVGFNECLDEFSKLNGIES